MQDNKMNMKQLFYFFIFCSFLLLSLASATDIPRVIYTSINLTVSGNCTTTSYTFNGEGGIASDNIITQLTFSGNCSGNYSYNKANIPITFSRTFYENETDLAVLLNSLAVNNNLSSKWQDCIEKNRVLDTNLTICNMDIGYKSNYTVCINDIDSLQKALTAKNEEIAKQKSSIEQLTSHRMLLIVIAALLGGLAYNYWRKTTPKMVKSPIAYLPSASKT